MARQKIEHQHGPAALHGDRLAQIQRFLQSNARLAAVEVDEHFRCRGQWGELEAYGYPPLDTGAPCDEHFVFLYGYEFGTQLTFRFVETPNGNAAHVFLFPAPGGVLVTFIDATLERDQRAEIQQHAGELSLLAHAQRKLLRQLEEANDAKGRFIANLSHELRTPLTTIIGYSQLADGSAREQAQQHLRAVGRAGRHLLALVDNLLDHVRLELADVEPQISPLQLAELIGDLRAVFEPAAAAKGIELVFTAAPSLPPGVRTDATRLRQVLINLIANAIKFTARGSVQVRLAMAQDVLVIAVEDTGPGIRADEQARLFQPFVRGRDITQHGVGLGLAITRQLLLSLGGSIALRSTPGQGSCFELELPVARLQEPGAAASPSAAAAAVVLVVDDDPDIREFLRIALGGAGYQVETAADAQGALRLLRRARAELVLIDVSLGGDDGLRLVRELRARGFERSIAVSSASTERGLRERAAAAGADLFLPKPFELTRLLELIAQCLHGEAALARDDQLRQLRARFISALAERRRQLRQVAHELDAQRWSLKQTLELAESAHRLAGAAGLHGLLRVSQAAAALEDALGAVIDAQGSVNIAELRVRARASLTRLLEALEASAE